MIKSCLTTCLRIDVRQTHTHTEQLYCNPRCTFAPRVNYCQYNFLWYSRVCQLQINHELLLQYLSLCLICRSNLLTILTLGMNAQMRRGLLYLDLCVFVSVCVCVRVCVCVCLSVYPSVCQQTFSCNRLHRRWLMSDISVFIATSARKNTMAIFLKLLH